MLLSNLESSSEAFSPTSCPAIARYRSRSVRSRAHIPRNLSGSSLSGNGRNGWNTELCIFILCQTINRDTFIPNPDAFNVVRLLPFTRDSKKDFTNRRHVLQDIIVSIIMLKSQLLQNHKHPVPVFICP